MSSKKLGCNFYNQKTLQVAQKLLGKFLVHKIGQKKIVGMITETEAYCGPKDLASHASRGRTPRTEIMFGQPGYAYVYLIYGMYYCFNIVTERKNYPAAVLIRGIISDQRGRRRPSHSSRQNRRVLPDQQGLDFINGPGKVCRYMKIDKKLNGLDLTENKFWVENRGVRIKKPTIKKGKRIGVDYAGKYKDKLWRFYIKNKK